jgi:hypothetical protein
VLFVEDHRHTLGRVMMVSSLKAHQEPEGHSCDAYMGVLRENLGDGWVEVKLGNEH